MDANFIAWCIVPTACLTIGYVLGWYGARQRYEWKTIQEDGYDIPDFMEPPDDRP